MLSRLFDRIHATQDTAMLELESTALPDAAEPYDDQPVKKTSILRIEWLLSAVPRKAIMAATETSTSTVTEWKRTGRIDKRHLPKLAALTGTKSEWWLDPDAPVPPTAAWLTSVDQLPVVAHNDQDAELITPLHNWPATIPVPMFSVRVAAGPGEIRPDDDPLVGVLHINVAWAKKHLGAVSLLENLATLTAHGHSMHPTFSDGATLLIDTGIHEVKSDGIYVLALDDQLYVKRVTRRLPDGALIVSSDNPLHQGFVIENGERSVVQILGRVAWAFDSKPV